MMVDEDSQEAEERDWAEEERIEFEENLDRDGDGLLGYEEIQKWLAPDEMTFFQEEARHLLSHVDQDKVSGCVMGVGLGHLGSVQIRGGCCLTGELRFAVLPPITGWSTLCGRDRGGV